MTSRRRVLSTAILLAATAVAVAAVRLPPSHEDARPRTRRDLSAADITLRPTPGAAAAVIEVEILSGRLQAAEDEVSITTIFREDTFTLLATETPDGGARDLLHRHVRELFSLKEVVSLGASIVPLSGGSAILDADGERMEIRVHGQMAGDQMVRLVVSDVRNGQEEVATSVLARRGRTVVLTAPGPAGADGDERLTFVCLTPR